MKTEIAGPAKEFNVWNSPKSFRFKQEAIFNHAPQYKGIYQLVTFDDQQNAQVVYMELTKDQNIDEALQDHLDGKKKPTVEELLAKNPNLYFSYLVEHNAATPEDEQDLFWAMVQSDKPLASNPPQPTHSGRYSEITVKDKSIL
jgi:hypothetical protein